MKNIVCKNLSFALFSVLLCAHQAQAAETQTVEQAGVTLPAATAPQEALAETTAQPFVINVSWQNYIDESSSAGSAMNLNGVEPAAGLPSDMPGNEGFTLSLSDQAPSSVTPPKYELSYTTQKNFSMRTRHSGLMLTKKFKFEPERVKDVMPDSGAAIDKPQFSQ